MKLLTKIPFLYDCKLAFLGNDVKGDLSQPHQNLKYASLSMERNSKSIFCGPNF